MDDETNGLPGSTGPVPSGLAARTDPIIAATAPSAPPAAPPPGATRPGPTASAPVAHPAAAPPRTGPARGDPIDRLLAIANNTNVQVALGIALIAVVIGGVAKLLGAQAKEIVSVATAIAGLSTIAVGLALSKDAFKLLYDKEAHQKAEQGKPEKQTALQSAATGITSIPGVAIDLNELLPKLITRAAGLAIAVLLFGVLLLAGASFSTPGTSTTSSTTSTTSSGTSTSTTTTATETTQVTTTTR